MNNLGVKIYKTYKWELFLSRVLPYWLPFISKRKRVRIKWYWKYKGRRRACTALTKALMSIQYRKPVDFTKLDFSEDDWEWEIIKDT